jgi:hypothetical protein
VTDAAYSYVDGDPVNESDPAGLCPTGIPVTRFGTSLRVSTTADLASPSGEGIDEAIDCTPLQVHPLGDGRIVIIELCFRLDGSTFVRERVVFEEDTLPPDWFTPSTRITLSRRSRRATQSQFRLTPYPKLTLLPNI